MDAATDTPPLIDGRYRLLQRVGVGGMSSVYRAQDEQLGREVAIKLFPTAVGDDEDARRRHDEVRLLGSIVHPALVTLYDAALEHDPPYLSMEYVDGEDLRVRLRRGTLDVDAVSSLGAAIADALAAIHARGIVHRDLKPGNILLPSSAPRTGAAAKLADFGIARLVDSTRVTAAGTLIGTAAYLSPEQAAGRPVGPASDVYALGLVLLECLTGRQAYPGNAVEAAAARLSSPPEIPEDLPSALVGLLSRMTAIDPEHRPSAADAAAALGVPAPSGSGIVTEPLEATRRLPAASQSGAPTPAAAPGAVPATASEAIPAAQPTAVATERPPARRGTRIVLGVVAAVLAAAVATAVWIAVNPESVGAPPAYPPVDGPLGEHLQQLQDAVAP